MEHKNNCNCPRDMVDDELLRRILGEKECCTGIFGCGCRRQSERDESVSNKCPDRMMYRCRERRQDNSDDCRKNSDDKCREKENRCGCRERREESSNNCGCRERREESPNRCGCRENRREESCIDSRREETECGEKCARDNRLASFPLAMVYSPDQEWRDMYCEEEALSKGTMFRELDLPFYPSCRSCD